MQVLWRIAYTRRAADSAWSIWYCKHFMFAVLSSVRQHIPGINASPAEILALFFLPPPFMPSTAALSEAAIALSTALNTLGVERGIFGGYAVAVLGGPRASKDIDCAVDCNKEWLVEKLSTIDGFTFTGNVRADLAVFLWGDKSILIELFPSA